MPFYFTPTENSLPSCKEITCEILINMSINNSVLLLHKANFVHKPDRHTCYMLVSNDFILDDTKKEIPFLTSRNVQNMLS